MLYDNAYNHTDPGASDLPPEAGATHIGMFLAWAVLNGLGNPAGAPDEALIDRAITPRSVAVRGA